MYIFPADELIYLSYNRIIYVPMNPPEKRISLTIPNTTNMPSNNNEYSTTTNNNNSNKNNRGEEEEEEENDAIPLSSCNYNENNGSDKPSTSRASVVSNYDHNNSGNNYYNNNSDSNNRSSLKKQSSTIDDGKLKIPKATRSISNCSDKSNKSKGSKSQSLRKQKVSFNSNDKDKPKTTSSNNDNNNDNNGQLLSMKIGSDLCQARANLYPQQHVKTAEGPLLKKKLSFFRRGNGKKSKDCDDNSGMAKNESPLQDLIHPSYHEHLKIHNSNVFKLVKTIADFTQKLGQLHERHSAEILDLVTNFRQKNTDFQKERPICQSSLYHLWESLLQEVQIDSQTLNDISTIFIKQMSRHLLERSYHRKIQSKNVFTHKESYETIIAKTEEKLNKYQQAYENAYFTYMSTPTTDNLSSYFNAHNAYVQQLHATNGMLDEYNRQTLPSLLQELDDIYTDVCSTVSETILQGAELVTNKTVEQSKRYNNIVIQCKSVSPQSDLALIAKSISTTPSGRILQYKKPYIAPRPYSNTATTSDINLKNNECSPALSLKNELVLDHHVALQLKPAYDVLKKESIDLETKIRQIQDALETLLRIQQRSIETALFNKANELEEEIAMKRFDLKVTRIHLAAVSAQKELFISKLEGDNSSNGHEKKTEKLHNTTSASPANMKNKWLKAFKTLKALPLDRANGAAAKEVFNNNSSDHHFQEYTYKKITPCDICSQVLRGHTRQGLKCKLCKMNVHFGCQEKATKCQTKAKLLRRQKSTSEIDVKFQNDADDQKKQEVDQTYQVLKQATKLSNKSNTVGTDLDFASIKSNDNTTMDSNIDGIRFNRNLRQQQQQPQQQQSQTTKRSNTNLAVLNSDPFSSCSAPHSPHRPKLNLRMKSLSLDSPESSEYVQRRKYYTSIDPYSNQSSSSRIQSPASPVHNRRLMSANNIKMSSMEVSENMEMISSSASISPCPSPSGGNKKCNRILPNNLYVVLYNFKSRHQDELDLKAGYKVTVIDTSDPDWWKGKCLGRTGFFPSKYVTKLSPGEKPLQVTHNLQVSDGDNGLMLLRDQIVIQMAEELDGMVMIRSGDNRQGVCPVKFLQEV